ncbi:hypothetical protein BY996DRAFT_6410541 [Phakopsora pachyrhizi]|nr:hypothetical protein BY996DRAFT_6410541 [Phakopsora pachyrhizi]
MRLEFVIALWLLPFWNSFSLASEFKLSQEFETLSHAGAAHIPEPRIEILESNEGFNTAAFRKHENSDLHLNRENLRTSNEEGKNMQLVTHKGSETQFASHSQPSGNDPGDLNFDPYKELSKKGKKYRPPNPDESGSKFTFPRIPPDDEWKIKTWSIKVWRPLYKKLKDGLKFLSTVVSYPFISIIKAPKTGGSHNIPFSFEKFFNKYGAWKFPKQPPAYSNDELIETAYFHGEKLSKSKGIYQDDILKKWAEEENLSGLQKELVTSNDYANMLRELYNNRINLALKHKDMEHLSEEILQEWGGARNVKNMFEELLDLAKQTHQGQDPIPAARSRGSKKVGGVYLESIDPSAYEMHLSPLLVLAENKYAQNLPDLTAHGFATGYGTDDIAKIDKLKDQAKQVQDYSHLSASVHRSQFAVEQYMKKLEELRKSEMVNPESVRELFKRIAEAKEFPPPKKLL